MQLLTHNGRVIYIYIYIYILCVYIYIYINESKYGTVGVLPYTATFSIFDLYLYSAYAAHYVYIYSVYI